MMSLEFHQDDLTYGTLTITSPTVPVCLTPRLVRFQIDCSGSMSDIGKDGQSKMYHTHQTLFNILRELARYANDVAIHVEISAFDADIHSIVPLTKVTPETLSAMSAAIRDKLYPMEVTDMEKALGNSSEAILAYLADHPTHVVSHILMTDGDANHGRTEAAYLASLVVNDARVTNTFIALGMNHNDDTMCALGNAEPRSSNWLIAKSEHAGMVYGEILHRELFAAATDMELSGGTSCSFYDYKTSTFVPRLFVPVLTSESTRVFHVQRINPDDEVTIRAQTDVVVSSWTAANLTKHLCRLQTQQWMFKAKQCDADDQDEDFFCHKKRRREEHQTIRRDLEAFFDTMQLYIKTHHLEQDAFWKSLSDDMYLTIHSLGTHRQNLCISTRETSQGRQQCYNVTDFEFVRQEGHGCGSGSGSGNGYDLSQAITVASNETPTSLRLMRACSTLF